MSQEVLIIGYLVIATFMDFKSIQGDYSCTAGASLTNQRVTVTYNYFKFHENPFSGYLDMAPDERTERRAWTKQYPSTFGVG